MKLTFDVLKQNVVLVKTLKSFVIAYADDYFEDEEIDEIKLKHKHISVNEDGEVVIEAGFEWALCVQTHNFHFELKRLDLSFDASFDEDEDLAEHFEIVKIIGENAYFAR